MYCFYIFCPSECNVLNSIRYLSTEHSLRIVDSILKINIQVFFGRFEVVLGAQCCFLAFVALLLADFEGIFKKTADPNCCKLGEIALDDKITSTRGPIAPTESFKIRTQHCLLDKSITETDSYVLYQQK